MRKVNTQLDNQEKRIERALEKKEYVSVPNLDDNKKIFQEAIKNYQELTKTKRITIRINNEDLIKIKARAKRNNIPYQTLLKALIRQFVAGQRVIQL